MYIISPITYLRGVQSQKKCFRLIIYSKSLKIGIPNVCLKLLIYGKINYVNILFLTLKLLTQISQLQKVYLSYITMKAIFSLLLLFSISILLSQNSEKQRINLSEIKLCELTLNDLRNQDENLKEVEVIEMITCTDGFVTDNRFENRKGYSSHLYPGIIFQTQEYKDIISKIRLTKDFKGNLSDGTYIDLNTLTAKVILEKYPTLNTWNSRGCSDYWSLTNKEIYFFVKINTNKEPRYPIDEKYYMEQQIEGIDIVSDCNSLIEKNSSKNQPLYILDGKEVNTAILESIKPENIESINVLKGTNAIDKYGEKGTNGVIEILSKKK